MFTTVCIRGLAVNCLSMCLMTSQSSSSGSSSDSSDSEKDGATSGDSDQPLKAPTPKSTRKPRTKASKVRENTFGPFGVCVIKSACFIPVGPRLHGLCVPTFGLAFLSNLVQSFYLRCYFSEVFVYTAVYARET